MAENMKLNTRIISKHAGLDALNSSSFVPFAGEIVLAEVTTYSNSGVAVPTYLIKVGDGSHTFAELKWAGAQALDVYSWAKQQNLPTKIIDTADNDGNVIKDIQWVPAADASSETDATLRGGYIKITKDKVATTDAIADLQALIDALEAEDTAIRGEFAAADTAIRGEFAAADNVVRGEFAAADTALKNELTPLISAAQKAGDDAAALAATKVDQSAYDTKIAALEAADTASGQALEAAKTEIQGKIDAVDALADQGIADAATAQAAAEAAAAAAQGAQDTADSKVSQSDYNTAIGEINTAIGAINNSTTGILVTAKKYTDDELAAAKTEISAEIDGDVKVVSDALATEIQDRKDADSALESRIAANETAIEALNAATTFAGADTLANRPETADVGDIYVATDNSKEYIYTASGWVELGDVTAETQRLTALEETVNGTDSADGLVDKVADLESTRATKTELNQAIEGVNGTINGVDGRLTTLEGTVADGTNGLAATKAIADAANAQANTNKGDIATINETLSKLDNTYATDAELEDAVDALEGSISEVSGVANQNKADIATINGTLATTTSTANEALETANANTQSIATIENTYATDAELEEVSDALAGAKTELQGNIDGVAGRVTTAEGKITTIENTLNDEASGLAATKAIADEAKAAAATNATAIGSLEDAVDALEDAVDVIEADYIRVDKATNQMFVGADVIIFDCGGVE